MEAMQQSLAGNTILEQLRRNLEGIRLTAASPISEELRRSMEAMQQSLTGNTILEQLRRNLEGIRLTAASPISEELRRSMQVLARNLAVQTDFSVIREAIGNIKSFDKLAGYLVRFEADPFQSLHIQNNGSVVVDGETVTSVEMQQAIAELVGSPHSLLSDIDVRLSRLRAPLQKIIYWFLQAVLAAMIQIVLTPFFDPKYNDANSATSGRIASGWCSYPAGDTRRNKATRSNPSRSSRMARHYRFPSNSKS
jgi:hypothetical protein